MAIIQLLKYLRNFRCICARNFSLCKYLNAVNKNTVESLERLALVDFQTDAAIKRLDQSVTFADNLMEIDTSGVEPLISTVYDRNDNLILDEPIGKSCRKELMGIAPVTEEFYYVAPLGTFSRKEGKTGS